MLNIYLLRHGQTAWNADGNRYCGRTDLPLTETGLQQAQLAAEQLKNIPFDAVYSSPLERAFRTAQIASGRPDVKTDDRLIEADFGQWESKAKEVFIPENEQLWQNWCEDPANTRAGGTGESAQEIVTRVDDFFQDLRQQYPIGNVMVVAHNGVNRFYLAYKLGMPLKYYRRLVLDNSSITHFGLDETGEISLIRLNSKL
ncbi:histidine phosphatase family protein [Adhaeribacter rhizoryzae]|uniref:Histidine phosphatase family protein n=1 Tax=Adhaeribacter rhizoryzae TaxID=2607907 RepID=A0A5M6DJ66_9BACT|nr:histidine phosphatase family protein [Adhaeribacter rhizoryzae]KAA5547493.1 histidine phosphatase family protein [Adhaeribacter rhizoryzae]